MSLPDPASGPATLPAATPFAALTPTCLLEALEAAGWRCDGRVLALNSFENRVYQIGLDDGQMVVAKFYRPGRWRAEQILEEHRFTLTLAAADIPVVAPFETAQGTLHQHAGYAFAVYPRRGGRALDLEVPGTLERLGRLLGRIHALGRTAPFLERPALTVASHGHEPRAWLLEHGNLPADLRAAWQAITEQCLAAVTQAFERVGPYASLRLHGDLHAGNVLWTDAGPHCVDFDDARSGPAIQDLWMLLAGDPSTMSTQLSELMRGYQAVCDFDGRELALIEPLRTLRLIHYSAWLAQRWHDPAFPLAFPWFGTARYWQDRILELREQLAAMAEAPLTLSGL